MEQVRPGLLHERDLVGQMREITVHDGGRYLDLHGCCPSLRS
jgi:hypothetical protein